MLNEYGVPRSVIRGQSERQLSTKIKTGGGWCGSTGHIDQLILQTVPFRQTTLGPADQHYIISKNWCLCVSC